MASLTSAQLALG